MFRVVLVLMACLPAIGHTENPKAVLVTGASTGIGHKITEKLAADGYFVYAGARKEEDLKALGSLENVQPIRLDVTDVHQIDAAVQTIIKAGRGLHGLVNNAGIATVGSLGSMKPEEFDLLMATNVSGPYRVTRAFQSLLIEQKGRIVNIGSLSGTVATADLMAYAMSKHAVEAFTDSLAKQMEASGVQVSIIEPGNYNTSIGKSFTQRTGVDSRMADRSKYPQSDDVAAAVEQALFEPQPRRRYLIVPVQSEAEIVIRKQIEQLVQLNAGHRFTYDREALVNMLDEALAASQPRTPSVNGGRHPLIGTWYVKDSGAPFPYHMYVFNADGTLQQANPDAGDARTSDSDGKGIWIAQGDRVKCKWMEVLANRKIRKYAGRLEVSCDLQVSGDTFTGTESVTVFDDQGKLTEGPTQPTALEGKRVTIP